MVLLPCPAGSAYMESLRGVAHLSAVSSEVFVAVGSCWFLFVHCWKSYQKKPIATVYTAKICNIKILCSQLGGRQSESAK